MPTYTAQYSDGHTAAATLVNVRIARESLAESLHIADVQGQSLDSWPLKDVEAPHGVPRDFTRVPLVLRRADQNAACRLTFSDPHAAEGMAQELAPWLKAKKRRHTAFWVKATLAVWVFALVLWLGLPAFSRQIATLIPQEWELTLGDQTLRQLETMMAKPYNGKNWAVLDDEATTILNALMTRLEMAENQPALPLRIRIMYSDEMNAFALPGNTIVVTTAMLAEMEHLDELAAILAHERAHVRLRHTTQLLLRHTTFRYLLEVFGASISNSTAQMLLSLGWSREMEREADGIALASMRQAGISPHGFTRFFRRLQAKEDTATSTPSSPESSLSSGLADITSKLGEILSTHPGAAERADAAEKIPPYPCTPIYGERTWKETSLYVRTL